MMTSLLHKTAASALLMALLGIPGTANAYALPEEVLFSNDLYDNLYLPPRSREAKSRVSDQQFVSEVRRTEEQEDAFAAQRPPEPVETEPMEHAAAPEMPALTDNEYKELSSTLRLLERIEDRQRTMRLDEELRRLGYHSGAPGGGFKGQPLAPTGAGGIVTGIAMLGAAGWTWRKSKKLSN